MNRVHNFLQYLSILMGYWLSRGPLLDWVGIQRQYHLRHTQLKASLIGPPTGVCYMYARYKSMAAPEKTKTPARVYYCCSSDEIPTPPENMPRCHALTTLCSRTRPVWSGHSRNARIPHQNQEAIPGYSRQKPLPTRR